MNFELNRHQTGIMIVKLSLLLLAMVLVTILLSYNNLNVDRAIAFTLFCLTGLFVGALLHDLKKNVESQP